MKKILKKYFIGLVIISIFIIGLAIRNAVIMGNTNDNSGKEITASSEYILAKNSEDTASKFAEEAKIAADESNKTMDAMENVTYPDLTKYPNLSVSVSIKKQRMKILSGGETIFEAVVSTGMDKEEHATPVGDFVIEPEREEYFFNADSGEGAKYAVSFRDHGIYLFHSVPVDENGDIIQDEAERLGQPSSHGCIRMTMENAKWFYENIPEGIPVHVSEN